MSNQQRFTLHPLSTAVRANYTRSILGWDMVVSQTSGSVFAQVKNFHDASIHVNTSPRGEVRYTVFLPSGRHGAVLHFLFSRRTANNMSDAYKQAVELKSQFEDGVISGRATIFLDELYIVFDHTEAS